MLGYMNCIHTIVKRVGRETKCESSNCVTHAILWKRSLDDLTGHRLPLPALDRDLRHAITATGCPGFE